MLWSTGYDMEEHLHDTSTTDERPFSDEAEKTLHRGLRMMVNDIAFGLRDSLDAQSIRQEVTLDIEKVHHQIDEMAGDIIQNTDAVEQVQNDLSEVQSELESTIEDIQSDVSMLIDNEVSQNDLDDIRRQLDVLTNAISNMLQSNADNAADVSTQYQWALKNTDLL